MASWSPLDAMKAYMNTLQLCKDRDAFEEETSKVVEPKCMEYVSALAAGNRARLMVDAESGGTVTPFVLALAAAARQTGGRLVCIRHEEAHAAELRAQILSFGLADVVECEAAGGRPMRMVIERLENVDFAILDHALEDCGELVAAVDANPCGAVVVVSNLFKAAPLVERGGGGGNGSGSGTASPPCASYGQLVKWKERGGARSVVLPFGGGMEVTRFGRRSHWSAGKRRRRRKFVVYYEAALASKLINVLYLLKFDGINEWSCRSGYRA